MKKLTVIMLAIALVCTACGRNRPGEAVTAGQTVQTLPGMASLMTGPGKSETEAWDNSALETITKDPTDTPTKASAEPASEAFSESSTDVLTEPVTEAPTEAPAETLTEAPTEAETLPETPVATEESSSPLSGGLWSPVPTLEADWATRAVCEQYYTNEDFGFTTYASPYDRDGDGIEDQADILQGARDYVATRPEYDAGYFETGWPPAGKGVCTDVFNYAMLAAGYNMQELVDRDVHLRSWAYEWEVGDNKIDFRRTRNLLVFCDEYLEKLTLDPYDYEAWQPGDVVIFAGRETWMWPGHIAIVSDRRASDGLPYLIHHTDNDRFSYEQDFLTTPQRIIMGHYRVGNLSGHGELFNQL